MADGIESAVSNMEAKTDNAMAANPNLHPSMNQHPVTPLAYNPSRSWTEDAQPVRNSGY